MPEPEYARNAVIFSNSFYEPPKIIDITSQHNYICVCVTETKVAQSNAFAVLRAMNSDIFLFLVKNIRL